MKGGITREDTVSYSRPSSLRRGRAVVHLVDAGHCACDKAEHPEPNDEKVLPEKPVETTEPVLVLPHDNQLNDGGEHEAEGGEADSTDQRDEGAQVWHQDSHNHSEHNKNNSKDVFSKDWPGGEPVLERLPDNLHGDIELEGVSEEDSSSNHDLY